MSQGAWTAITQSASSQRQTPATAKTTADQASANHIELGNPVPTQLLAVAAIISMSVDQQDGCNESTFMFGDPRSAIDPRRVAIAKTPEVPNSPNMLDGRFKRSSLTTFPKQLTKVSSNGDAGLPSVATWNAMPHYVQKK